MRLADVVQRLEGRARDAEAMDSTARIADVLRAVLRDLEQVDLSGLQPRYVASHEAARMLGMKPKTIANWCNAGRFSGAIKSSGRAGKWLIPAAEVYKAMDAVSRHPTRPRLWRRE